MKKTGFILSIMLTVSILTGCAGGYQGKSTGFESLQVQKSDSSIISEGIVQLQDMDAMLMTVEVSGDITGVFQLTYSKEKGPLNIRLDETELLELENDAVNDVVSEEIAVALKKGRNNFIISGQGCSCEFLASLAADDISRIVSFGGGSTVNRSGRKYA